MQDAMQVPVPEREPVRVLQVLGSSAGGVARHVRQLGEVLGAVGPGGPGWTVHVAGPAALADDVAPPAGPVVFRPVEIADRPRPADLAAIRRLRALAAGAHVLHAHGLRAGALAVLATRGLPGARRPRVVVTLHNLPVGGRAVRTVSAVLERVVARGADKVLGVSGDLVDRARALGARTAERALVPAPSRPRTPADAAAVREALGVPGTDHLLVTVARLAPQKGLDTLLDAARRLVVPGVFSAPPRGLVWVVAGDGPLHDALAARIGDERLPVRLLGRRSDVPDLLAAADVVVSTAVWEGQPIAVQEALQLGAAVVATDAGGTREVTGDDGAVLVPVGDAAAVAGAVRALLDDRPRRDRLRAAAGRRAAELPDVAAVVEQLRRVYDA
ncbi:glycosyltransferase family 4 protein [uncultured Cellulomonas sp.]|uniref:glycosyltransferase family 4 protein n=1 Tax=uncultured Cellulomonas sp. TaxID=189682 RepID=UPI002614A5A4|nr:glycosyltransferase family 4 protein [uncultured Cellulomonas sp.]